MRNLGLLNVEEYYDLLLQLFDRAVDDQFLRADLRHLVIEADQPEVLLDRLASYKSSYVDKWVGLPVKP